MNVLSLFSGIGGLDLGLERAGMTVVGQVEIDPWCQRVLAKHWPEVPRHDDVRTAAGWWLAEPRPPVDLICGGFPCQPVSVAGKRLAQADERWLWPAFADTIRQLRPRFALMENVPGLLAAGMGDVLGDLAACGYDAEWDCVPASAVGAPHQRDRVWIVAHANGGRLEVGAECHCEQEQDPANGHSRGLHADRLRDPLADAGCQGREPGGLRGGTAPQGQVLDVGTPDSRERCGHVAHAEGQRGELRQAAGERSGRSAGGRAPVADTAGTRSPNGRSESGGRSGPARWPQPERLGWWAAEPDVGRVAHGIPRRVDRLRGLGNAVVPQVAEHIGRLIMEAAA